MTLACSRSLSHVLNLNIRLDSKETGRRVRRWRSDWFCPVHSLVVWCVPECDSIRRLFFKGFVLCSLLPDVLLNVSSGPLSSYSQGFLGVILMKYQWSIFKECIMTIHALMYINLFLCMLYIVPPGDFWCTPINLTICFLETPSHPYITWELSFSIQ